MNTRKITILLADDHSLMRIGLKTLLDCQRDMTVIGEAANGKAAVELAARLRPDIIIMDLMMPEMDGVSATEAILGARPETGIILLTSFGASADLALALRHGARGAQLKESPTDELLAAIRTVAAGGTAISGEIRQNMEADGTPVQFTERQANVLNSLARGLSNQDIAKQYGITPSGVKRHLRSIFAKLGAATRAEAVAIALRKHLLKI